MRYTEAPARREELLRRLAAEGYLSSVEVAEELGVSEMTIRRDLRQLAVEGLARRVPGGASLPSVGGFGAPFEERDRQANENKAAIVAATLPLLEHCATIAIDAGTTVASLAAMVVPGTTIVTHSVPVIANCTARDDIDLIAIGGTYQRDTRSFAGSVARVALATLSVDVAVLSTTALDSSGVLCANTFDAEIKQGMSSIAATTILLADHTKIGGRAPIRFGSLDMIDIVVTDDGVDEASIRMLTDAGVRVVVASTRHA